IMVGEIRDKETAAIAVQAALTGHLVMSTLHTNDATSSIARLTDMGIEPFLMSSAILGILAQRLIRKVCVQCKETFSPPPEVIEEFHLPSDASFVRGKGCPVCRQTGYKGRTGIYELLLLDDATRRLIISKTVSSEISTIAKQSGMENMRHHGLSKVLAGETTLEEVLRVTTEIY
ncbi:MAG TPA: ATPase, T2SS/T4P/T4SS family, partial [Nitrospiria bacterium]|nr:ATPase, T2SS/T4P/T4SS family [Nitrospiria bacterium]